MRQLILWRTGLQGALSAEVGSLRLVVRTADNCARFLVLREPRAAGISRPSLLASGTADTVRSAMEAAERTLGGLEVAGFPTQH